MTLVLSIQTRGSIWLCVDRRLSASGWAPVDSAIKAATIETHDGAAIVGYAGLGTTALGTEPSEWVINVLRGGKLSVEQSLDVIAAAMNRQFRPHLSTLREVDLRQHHFVIPALVGGVQRLYAISLVGTENGYDFKKSRGIMGGYLLPLQVPVPLGIGGSGAGALLRNRTWKRPLLRLVRAYNEKSVSERVVSDRLAALCYLAHENTRDGSVGPSCMVVWKNSKKGPRRGGGGHAFYSGLVREGNLAPVPTLANGMDIKAIAGAFMDAMLPKLHGSWDDLKVPNDEINARLAKLPGGPDERLR